MAWTELQPSPHAHDARNRETKATRQRKSPFPLPLTNFVQAQFMLEYLERIYGSRATAGDKSVLYSLRAEAARLEALVEEQKKKQEAEEASEEKGKKHEPENSEDETDEDDEDDYVDVLPEVIKNKNKGPRTSVSSEAFGIWNKKENF